MKRALNIIFYTIFVSVLLGVGGLLIASMLPIPLPGQTGKIEIKIVRSGSMEPNIPTGSLVIVKPESSYSIGDVITFGADTQTQVPTTHRIVAYEAGENGATDFQVKGDANEDPDPNPVRRADVIGKVAFHVPKVGYVLAFARTPLGFALLVGIPAALVILEELMVIFREGKAAIRRRKGKRDKSDDGGSPVADSSGAMRLVYLRKRAMDEIFIPMFVEPMISSAQRLQKNLGAHKDAYATSTALVAGLVCVSTLMAGGAGGTLSYFNDAERSLGNIFRAGQGWEVPVLPDEPGPMFSLSTLSLGAPEGEVLGESTDTPPEEPEADPPPEDTTTPPETPPEPEPESGSQSGNAQDSPMQEKTPPPSDPPAVPAPETPVPDPTSPVETPTEPSTL